jgi:hypothetical protein
MLSIIHIYTGNNYNQALYRNRWNVSRDKPLEAFWHSVDLLEWQRRCFKIIPVKGQIGNTKT